MRWPVFRSRTATCTFSLPAPEAIVNRTARPPGRTNGKRCPVSPFAASTTVIAFGSPPPADTLISPLRPLAKTMVSSGPQLAPREAPPTPQMVIGGPPVIGTFRISPACEEPDPASIGGHERLADRDDAGERLGVELIQRAHDQLRCSKAGADPVDDVAAVGRDRDVAIGALNRERLRRRGGTMAKRAGWGTACGTSLVPAHTARASRPMVAVRPMLAPAMSRRRDLRAGEFAAPRR